MAPMLCGQARIVLRYSLISATSLSDSASAHLVHWYSLISATTLSDHASTHLLLQYCLFSATVLYASASALLLCATTPQYCIVPSGTYCVVSYSFLFTGLGSQTVI